MEIIVMTAARMELVCVIVMDAEQPLYTSHLVNPAPVVQVTAQVAVTPKVSVTPDHVPLTMDFPQHLVSNVPPNSAKDVTRQTLSATHHIAHVK